MVLEQEWLQKLVDNLLLVEELKEEKHFLPKLMVRLESLKKSNQFRKALKEKRFHTEYYSIFAAKNFFKPNHKSNLLISFVMKKKIGNAVKRNKIRRKLKANVQKLLKKRGAINKDYTYIVFGKSNAYALKQDALLPLMEKSFSKLKK